MAAAPDFRLAAVAESMALLAERGANDPLDARISCCVPASPDAAQVRRRLRVSVIATLAMAFVGMGAGALILLADKTKHNDVDLMTIIGGIVGACGFCLLFLGMSRYRRLVRRTVLNRLGPDWKAHTARACAVNIEDAATFHKAKLIPEDSGLMLLHEDTRCVQIEGITHRYLVYDRDVIAIGELRGPDARTRSTGLAYRIGTTTLNLSIKIDGLGDTFKAGVGLRGNSALNLLQTTLGTTGGPVVPPVRPTAAAAGDEEPIQLTDEDEIQPPSSPPPPRA